MKILYFGVFERPYDTETYISNTLEALGHTVYRQPTNEATMPKVKRFMKKHDIDFILLSKGWFQDNNETFIKLLKSYRIPMVGWFFDITIGTKREARMMTHMAYRADIVCTTDGGHQKEFEAKGINHHVLRQGIYEPEAYMAKPEKVEDIVFVGTIKAYVEAFGWEHRPALVTWLHDTYGKQFGLYGTNDGVRNAALNTLYASCKVVVGDSMWSPNYWSNRLYETIGRSGFLIFPGVPGIEKEFTPYKHFVPYIPHDWSGLKEKIDYYLTHDEERERIRKAGFEYCKKYHTYAIRCKELIKIVEDYKKYGHTGLERAV